MLGFGLGLRTEHYQTIIDEHPQDIDWLEIVTENFLVAGGKPLYYLDQINAMYPLVMHGVSLSIGSTDPLNWEYLKKVKKLIKRINPKWISDHLCWTGVNKINTHDLLPLPHTTEAVEHVVARIKQVQDFWETTILLENPSSYITFKQSQMPEWEFLATIANEANCSILLDINNIYVNSYNHHFDPIDYINAIPTHRVKQFHLAGHSNMGEYIIDTHDAPVIDPVWQLYKHAIKRFGLQASMIERDDNIPELDELLNELRYAKTIATNSTTNIIHATKE